MRKSLTTLFGLVCSFLLVAGLVLPPAASAAAGALSIRSITWNVIGLDSNNPSTGPNEFPIGARICNTGTTAATNVVASFVRDGSNPYISVVGPSTLTFPSLAAGACTDAYFTVQITRTSAAYNTTPRTLRYHIAASADGAATVTTPLGYELYVEKLISQNRNSVTSVSGPTTVYVGQTYTYTLNSSTAPGGYEQIESFLNLSNVIFRINSVAVTYTASPSGSNGTGTTLYGDGCNWINDPANPNYRSCSGTGKYGGNMTTTYSVTVLSTGTTTVSNLIYDFSGSSYHYNSDFGTGINSLSITAVNPPDLALSLTGGGTFDPGTTGTLTVGVSNATGATATTGPATVTLTLPAGLTFVATGSGGSGYTCAASGQTITCTAAAGIAGGTSTTFPLVVAVGLAASGTLTVSGTVATSGDANAANNSASDVVSVATPSGRLGGTVFNDLNGNGLQDAGEVGLGSVTVTLNGPASATTMTAPDGSYSFGSLPAGTFSVSAATPPGTTATTANPRTVILAAVEDITGQNFGLGTPAATGSASGRVFNDLDGNGVQDAGEPGLASVTVTITPAGGAPVTVTTDANGDYTASGLPTGSATVTITGPAGMTLTTGNSPQAVTIGAGVTMPGAVGYRVVVTSPSQPAPPPAPAPVPAPPASAPVSPPPAAPPVSLPAPAPAPASPGVAPAAPGPGSPAVAPAPHPPVFPHGPASPASVPCAPIAPVADGPHQVYFPQTGHSLGGAFKAYWETNGGLAAFGYPLCEEFVERLEDGREYTVQYFERARFEYHPEHAGTPYEILLGRVGAETIAGRGGEAPFRTGPGMSAANPTGHAIAPQLRAYWEANGGLARFGLPLSAAFEEVNAADGKRYLVQYFERQRLEWHPENAGTPYEVELGLLGREALQRRGLLP